MEQCKLERFEIMKEILEEDVNSLFNERIQKLCKQVQSRETNLKTNLKDIVEKLTEDREKGTLTISFLRSSYITGSHEFHIAYYEGEAFVEEEPDCDFFNMKLLLDELEEDLKNIDSFLMKKFTRIIPAEKEEMHRLYMNQIYQKLWLIFEFILKEMETDKGIPVYYGGFMEEQEQIVTI